MFMLFYCGRQIGFSMNIGAKEEINVSVLISCIIILAETFWPSLTPAHYQRMRQCSSPRPAEVAVTVNGTVYDIDPKEVFVNIKEEPVASTGGCLWGHKVTVSSPHHLLLRGVDAVTTDNFSIFLKLCDAE